MSDIIVAEIPNSRRITSGDHPSGSVDYQVYGTDNQGEARFALDSQVASYLDVFGTGTLLIPRSDSALLEHQGLLWKWQVRYSWKANPPATPFSPQNANLEIDLNLMTSTQHIVQSLATTAYGVGEETPPDFKGGIGWTPNGLQGCDIYVPESRLVLTGSYAAADITEEYIRRVGKLRGKVNDDTYSYYNAGELLFLGMIMRGKACDTLSCVYHFLINENRDEEDPITVGQGDRQITDIVKNGHDFLWLLHEKDSDDPETPTHMVEKLIAAYVETVYESDDFGKLDPAWVPAG